MEIKHEIVLDATNGFITKRLGNYEVILTCPYNDAECYIWCPNCNIYTEECTIGGVRDTYLFFHKDCPKEEKYIIDRVIGEGDG